MINRFHKLLKKQIVNRLSADLLERQDLHKFLQLVNKTYLDNDEDKLLLENILNTNQKELEVAHKELKMFIQEQEKIIQKRTTDLVNTLQIVRDNEQRFKAILENLAELIIIVDSEYVINYVSPNIKNILGFNEKSFLNKNIFEFLSQENTNQFLELIKKVDSGNTFLSSTFIKLYNRKSLAVEFEVNLSNQIKNTTLSGFILTLRDVTEVREYQMNLNKQKVFYESILENIPVDIAVFDSNHRYKYLNPIAIRNPELREYIIGKDDFEYCQYRGRDKSGAMARRKYFLKAKSTHSKITWEEEIKDSEGHSKTLLRNFYPVYNNKSELDLMIGFGLDITDRKETEQKILKNEAKINKIMQSALDAIIIIDINGIVNFVNPSAEKLFGWSHDEMLNHKLTETIIPNYHSSAHEKGMNEFMNGKGGKALNRLLELPARKKDGSETIIELTIIPIQIDDSMFFCSFIRDISERKKSEREILELNLSLEEKVKQRTHQLESAIKELDSFSYSVSHDLRSPLRAVDGWSLALLEDYGGQLDDQGLNYIHRMRSESQRMGELIDDLLNLSRIGRTELKLVKIDLGDFATKIFERIIETNSRKDITFKVEEHIEIIADEKLLDIMFTNLISNAIKFSSKKTQPEITIGHKKEDGNEIFYIKDNGAGFNMHSATKLFGAFQRMHRQSDFAGTGVGLATVQRIVRAHGGEIWAYSKIDEGATFYFYFNQKQQHES